MKRINKNNRRIKYEKCGVSSSIHLREKEKRVCVFMQTATYFCSLSNFTKIRLVVLKLVLHVDKQANMAKLTDALCQGPKVLTHFIVKLKEDKRMNRRTERKMQNEQSYNHSYVEIPVYFLFE